MNLAWVSLLTILMQLEWISKADEHDFITNSHDNDNVIHNNSYDEDCYKQNFIPAVINVIKVSFCPKK